MGNVMEKLEKEKFALLSQESNNQLAYHNTNPEESSPEDSDCNFFREEEIPAEQSIEGAVLEIGDSNSDICYQIETEDSRLLEPVSQEKSLNQNVFESKVFVLNPIEEEGNENLSVFQEVDRSNILGDVVKLGEASSVLHFENANVDTAIIFDGAESNDMALESNAIFSYPHLVGDDQLEEVL